MQLGAGRLRIIEVGDGRRVELRRRWEEMRLSLVADAVGCEIEWCGLDEAYKGTPEEGWDRILVTGGLPRVPIGLLTRLSFEGTAVAAIGEEKGPVLQPITRKAEGEFKAPVAYIQLTLTKIYSG